MKDLPSKHILGSFEEAMENLQSSVLMMASLAKRGLDHAERGLFDRDQSSCGVAIADDEEIDSLEVQIDKEGFEILLRFQPFARDMRHVLAAMKMSSNIERVGDQTVSIARRALKLNQQAPLDVLPQMRALFSYAREMFQDAVRYYAENNQDGARKMKERDRELDQMHRDMTDHLADRMAEDTENLRGYLNLIFVSRVLERIGDHATNICEEVVFVCAAEDIRHTQKKPTP